MRNSFICLFYVAFIFACTPPEKSQLDTDRLIEDLQTLSSDEMQGRLTGTEGNRLAREFLLDRYEEEGLQPFQGSFVHPFSFTDRQGKNGEGINVIALLEGEIDSVILITAHYDHLGSSDSLIYNGADDNASGTAALLALADYFKQVKPNHTLVFAAFDKEEGGLKGARALAEDSLFLDKVVLNVNMDMIAQNTENEIYAVGTYHYPQLKPVLEGIDTGGLSLLFGHDEPNGELQDWTSSSDHGAFHDKGIPFIYFGVADHEYYHQPTDEFEIIPLEFYKKSVILIANAVSALDQSK